MAAMAEFRPKMKHLPATENNSKILAVGNSRAGMAGNDLGGPGKQQKLTINEALAILLSRSHSKFSTLL